ERLGVELELLYVGEVVRDGDGPDGHREVHQLAGGLLFLFGGHGRVGRAEVDRLVPDLADTAARTDGLIVDLHFRMQTVVLARPFRIERVRKRRTGAVQTDRLRLRGLGGLRLLRRSGLLLLSPFAAGRNEGEPDDDPRSYDL